MIRKVRARFANGVLTPLEPPTFGRGVRGGVEPRGGPAQAKLPKFLIDDPGPKALKRFV